jgi:hypothetical protein
MSLRSAPQPDDPLMPSEPTYAEAEELLGFYGADAATHSVMAALQKQHPSLLQMPNDYAVPTVRYLLWVARQDSAIQEALREILRDFGSQTLDSKTREWR